MKYERKKTYIGDDYEVDTNGNVYSMKFGEKQLTAWEIGGRYLAVTMMDSGKRKTVPVHRAVAMAFVPNPNNKREVNHIDGNKHNNRADNLEWTTRAENMKHAYKMGLIDNRGENSGMSKLKEEDILQIYELRSNGATLEVIGDTFGVSKTQVHQIVTGAQWAHLYHHYKK